MGPDQLLGDEGRVGAEHDQLAMRHVDDAHHPEGDGEPDRREQQHRAERQPEPDILRLRPQRLRALDLGDRRLSPPRRSLAARRGAAASAAASASRPPRGPRRPIASTFGGERRASLVRIAAPRASASAVPNAGVGLLRKRRVERRRLPRDRRSRRPRSPPPCACAGSGCISVSVEIAARIERRSELLTRIASVERAATGPSSAPVSSRSPAALEPRPVTRMIAPSDSRRCNSPSPSASSTAAARASPVAAIRATTSARSSKLPSGSRGHQLLERLRRSGPGRARASQIRTEARSRIGTLRNRRGRAGMARAPGRAQLVAPPHSPVAALKFPQDIGARQLAIRSANSGR